jgi:bacterioferritin (cytochrome b1)
MNDLIERLEKKLRFESVETGLVKDAITALREQEKGLSQESLSKVIAEQQTRIAELEQVLEIIADTSSSVDTRDIAEDALNRIRGNDE